MKLCVLVDNNTYIDKYFLGEPAVSYYLEDGNDKILFDLGYSDVFIKNAKDLNIDLSSLTKIVISHGHNDHTGGFRYLRNTGNLKQAECIAHPDALKEKYFEGESIGFNISQEEIKNVCGLKLTKTPVRISENIVFLGEIPAVHSFEEREAIGIQKTGDEFFDDYLFDDSALVYKGKNGLFIITGCSHSGICNIIEYAKKVCCNSAVSGVIGGFHLFHADMRLKKTIQYFNRNSIKELYPCHCVSFEVKAEINRSIPIHEVGVGLTIDI
ncbi:MBL fold metallo-hydrolase [Lachnospiraceae bacterium 54-53]